MSYLINITPSHPKIYVVLRRRRFSVTTLFVAVLLGIFVSSGVSAHADSLPAVVVGLGFSIGTSGQSGGQFTSGPGYVQQANTFTGIGATSTDGIGDVASAQALALP